MTKVVKSQCFGTNQWSVVVVGRGKWIAEAILQAFSNWKLFTNVSEEIQFYLENTVLFQ